jgi:hypothetical protein
MGGRPRDQAGTRPWRSMISRTFAPSDGPAVIKAASSRKYSGPSTPGVSTHRQGRHKEVELSCEVADIEQAASPKSDAKVAIHATIERRYTLPAEGGGDPYRLAAGHWQIAENRTTIGHGGRVHSVAAWRLWLDTRIMHVFNGLYTVRRLNQPKSVKFPG